MFDLEKAMAAWRRPYEHLRALSQEDLRELESYLRDEVEGFLADGLTPEQAFRQAVREMDDLPLIEQEYRKVYWKKRRHQGRILDELANRGAMIKNYVTVALRALQRHKGYAFINIFGLAVGIAVCLLILLFVRDELSFDQFHERKDRIYRIVSTADDNAQAYMPPLLGPILAADLPGIETVVRFHHRDAMLVGRASAEDDEAARFYEDGFVYADSLFFEVFSFDLVRGNPQTVLDKPYALVLTETMAQKYFGEADPVGQVLLFDESGLPFEITGVVKAPPATSSIPFNFIASYGTLRVHPSESGMYNSGWHVTAYPTYVLLRPGASAEAVASKLKEVISRHTDKKFILEREYTLEPLRESHFSQAEGGLAPGSDVRYVYIFGSIALLILLIACINYMNLATARATHRAREVGVRKVVGAHRGHLARQFLSESLLTSLFALVIAFGLVVLALPTFNRLVERAIEIDLVGDGTYALMLLGIVLFVGLVAGSYPALLLSRFQPVEVLKGRLGRFRTGASLRQGLVVFQFAISVALIVSTIIIQQQLHYMQTKRLGLDQERVVVLPLKGNARNQARVLHESLRERPRVLRAALSTGIPTRPTMRFGNTPEGWHEPLYVSVYGVEPTFLETLDLRLLEGRGFSADVDDTSGRTRAGGAVVNEALVRALGLEDPLGHELPLQFNGNTYRIVGVVQDFHYASLHEEIAPMMLAPIGDFWNSFVTLKLRASDYAAALREIEGVWKTVNPSLPFDFFFLDDAFDQLYKAEDRLAQIFNAFSLMAVVVACLGLFGLAAFTTEQRSKEIGVRKVLGASVPGIVALLSKEFFKLVTIAFVIAAPLAYFVMERWLEGFAYRVPIGAGTFVLAGLLALLIALLSVSGQALKAATSNPVKALRYE